MSNPSFSPPFQNEELSQIHEALDLEDRFNNLLSQSNSRCTAVQTLISFSHQQTYHSDRLFVLGTLQSWGIQIGTLSYSKDNQITLKCLLQLISLKQKDMAYRIKSKQQFNALNFEKEKYQSLLKQSKNTVAEKDKFLGKIQNQSLQLGKRIKSIQNKYKKQKTEDQRIIFMLKSKNQQILHEIKKKQAQLNKIKQQIKKSVTSKSITTAAKDSKLDSLNHCLNHSVKNSFQLIQKVLKGWNVPKANNSKKIMTQKMISDQNQSDLFQEQKHNFTLDRYYKQRKVFRDQNGLLRSKIYQIRQILVRFAEWMDVQLFGECAQVAKKLSIRKFICNHNLMFSKNALIDDLNQVIDQAKNGVRQLQDKLQLQVGISSSLKVIQSPKKVAKNVLFGNRSAKALGSEQHLMFRRKSTSIRENQQQKALSLCTSQYGKAIHAEKQPKRQIKSNVAYKDLENNHSKRVEFNCNVDKNQTGLISMPSQTKSKQSAQFFHQLQLSAFEHDILSESNQPSLVEYHNCSQVSHISLDQLTKQAKGEDKGINDKQDLPIHTQFEDEE